MAELTGRLTARIATIPENFLTTELSDRIGATSDPAPGYLRHLGSLFVAVVAAVVLFYRFRYTQGFLAFYDDDFFYYLKVARNLATTGVSTFDGEHLTNGYHPFWLLTLSAMYRIAPGLSFYYLLASFSFASTLSVYFLARHCVLIYARNELYADICSLVIAMYALVLMRGGMEVTLTMPLAFIFLWYRLRPNFAWRPGQAAMLGFLGSLMVLSRLDSGLLMALVFTCDAIYNKPKLKALLLRASRYIAGAGLIGVYLGVNRAIFHTWMPVSGEAKQLRLHHFPSLRAVLHLFLPFSLGKQLIAGPGLMIFLAAILYLLFSRREIGTRKPLICALVLFPVVHLAILAMLSDWLLWGWYLYPVILMMFGASILWSNWASERLASGQGRKLLGAMAAVVCLLWIAYTAKSSAVRKPESNFLYTEAREIETFASTHPGRYAMGDRSGLPGFLIKGPLIQLEGLMMDRQYLSHVRNMESLNQVLKTYDVRYYIVTSAPPTAECYKLREPAQAGPDSATMMGRFCSQPVARFSNGDIKAAIFDLTPAR